MNPLYRERRRAQFDAILTNIDQLIKLDNHLDLLFVEAGIKCNEGLGAVHGEMSKLLGVMRTQAKEQMDAI